MGKNLELKQVELKSLKHDRPTVKSYREVYSKDAGNIHLNYTNRRRMKGLLSENSNKTNIERKTENEQEFEDLCLHIQECSISKESGRHNISNRKLNAESTSASTTCSSESQVEEFRRFVQVSGGHYGGWKVKDHLFFLKVRKKYPLNKTAETVHENCPDISLEKVLEHDAWYNQYSKLRNANKTAIEEWKKQKPLVREEKKQEQNPLRKSAPTKRDPTIKQKIEVWRAKTLATNLERLEEQRQKEVLKKKEEENKKKLHEEKKALLNIYLKEKTNYDMAMKAAEEIAALQAKKETAQHTAKLLKYFRYEDRRFSERQKSRRKQQEKEEPKRRNAVQVKRDPSRLLRPTQGWIYRTKKNEAGRTSFNTNPLYINHLSRLGQPAWRKDLTS